MSRYLANSDLPIVFVTWRQLFSLMVIGFALLWLCHVVINGLGIGTDSSDLNAWNRSGVDVIVDYGTGCEYLESPEGYLTPRLHTACLASQPAMNSFAARARVAPLTPGAAPMARSGLPGGSTGVFNDGGRT